MNIGLIIYSQTGNTKSVAEQLLEELSASGHTVNMEQITITGNTPAQPGKFELTGVPAPDSYDAIIFGAPVQALSLNPVMKAYMEQLPSLSGKKVACFVTKQIPLLWFGGTGAIALMKKACQSKGAEVVGTEIVVWSRAKREQSIENCVKNLTGLF
ncbi:MAG: flavodoxin family protein [Bacillota bacterium]